MYHNLFIYSPIERHLGCFQVLAVMNKAAVNVCVQVFVGFTFPVHLDDYQGEQRFLLVCLCYYCYPFNNERDLCRL